MIEKVSWKINQPVTLLESSATRDAWAFRPPEHIPDQTYLCGTEILENSAVPISGVDAILSVLLDRGGRYCKATGWQQNSGSELDTTGNDPFCDEELVRLCVLDLRPGGPRDQPWEDDFFVECVRSRGDLILLDARGGSTGSTFPIQACPAFSYLRPGTFTPNSDLPTLGKSTDSKGYGTWLDQGVVNGRAVTYALGNVRFKFTAPTTKTLTGARFPVLAVRGQDYVQAQLYASDNTTPVGSVGAQEWISVKGVYVSPFNASVVAGTTYWLKLSVGTSIDVDLGSRLTNSAFASTRGGAALPNNDNWAMEMLG